MADVISFNPMPATITQVDACVTSGFTASVPDRDCNLRQVYAGANLEPLSDLRQPSPD
jgi:hypothetical protein